jgi:hypothetical protein
MAIEKKSRPLLSIRNPSAVKVASVEYRVIWNEAAQGWDVLRNGAATGVCARKKKKSAIDSAIRDAKEELKASEANIIVVSPEARKLETIWKSP